MFRACNALFGFVSVIYRAVFSNILPYVVTIRLERRFAVIYREFFANPLPFRWERVEGAEGNRGCEGEGPRNRACRKDLRLAGSRRAAGCASRASPVRPTLASARLTLVRLPRDSDVFAIVRSDSASLQRFQAAFQHLSALSTRVRFFAIFRIKGLFQTRKTAYTAFRPLKAVQRDRQGTTPSARLNKGANE